MIQKIRNLVIAFVAVAALGVPALAPTAVFAAANVQSNLCDGSNFQVDATAGTQTEGCTTEEGGSGVNELLRKIVNVISAIVGVVAVIMIIVGGFKYITSGGDSNNVSGAKNTIIYAIIGLIIVALAQVIVHFVLQQTPNA